MASEIKWFKFMNGMFEDEKIEYIESLPDGESIIIIWVKILCLASKSNCDGSLMITNELPYTIELLAHKFKKTAVQIQYAINIMQKLEMIDIIDNVISVSNWAKYQSVESLDKIREQTRLRVAKCRENKRLNKCNVTSNATVTLNCNENALISNSNSLFLPNSSNIEEEKKKEEEKKVKEKIPYKEIIDYFNEKTGKKYKSNSKETQRHIKARINEGFTLDDFKRVIDIKCDKWKNDPKMQDYLRPQTLFSNNFESYLNEAPKVEEVKEKSAQEIWAEKERQRQIEEAEERRRSEEEDRKFREEHPNVDMEKFHQLLRAGRFEEAHDYISKN